ncbi:molecular chaperone DnaJ [Salmonella enterica subsp. enterica serovar Poona]|nr:molecular chaperone DnaJ [Salmonella enterica]EIU8081463.1 molecular chaperone DnaJ [Salmonella enterica subsp. enterica serovar Poona]EEF6385518.1 molecular chaperone DnaJ [Salmonella enterica]EIV1955973.1 molecular chaperone DnaJ [Salmonella enterica subsp. enterica serovar Poona]EIV1980141.1 molecular chaperone DnaJ [Salmonella enterica subsp. enterica serovar Poona]
MTTITREEVKAFIEQIESDLSNGWEAQIFELKLARIALAALEADPEPVVPESISVRQAISALESADCVTTIGQAYKMGWNACRAAMLQGVEQPQNARQNIPENIPDGNSPAIPDGWVIVPKKLTAENGAKGVLSGEFSETTFISCTECFGDDDCDTCDGSGRIEIKVPVTWTTIKSIWDKGIAYFAAEPLQEVNRG